MNKQELLEECISLAYKINKFGAFVFVGIYPHIKQTDFRYYESGDYNKESKISLTVYEDQNYGEFKLNYKDNQPNNVEELHVFLTNLLKSKENENE